MFRQSASQRSVSLFIASGIAVGIASSAAGQTIRQVHWVGANNAVWNLGANWSPVGVPRNLSPFPQFEVTIDNRGGTPVRYDLPIGQMVRINTLTLTNDRELILLPMTGLTVLGLTTHNGIINCQGASLMAAMGDATMGRGRILVSEGGQTSLGSAGVISMAALVNARGCCSVVTDNWDVLLSEDPGSLLDLSSTLLLDNSHGRGSDWTNTHHRIIARDGGTIDLSSLEEVLSPSSITDTTQFIVSGSSSAMLLTSLRQVASAGRGQTVFSLSDGAMLTLPAIELLEDVMLSVTGGSQLAVTGAQPATLDLRGVLNAHGCCSVVTDNWDVVVSDGEGSWLDLRAVVLLDDSHGRGSSWTNTHHRIIARDNGVIDLSSANEFQLPTSSSDSLQVIADSGAFIDLSGLEFITGTGSGQCHFTVTGASSLRLLGTIPNTVTQFTVSPGSTLRVAGDFTHRFTDDTRIALTHAIVQFDGSVVQKCEVGGANFGPNACFLPNDAFGFGQLVVGQPGQPTTVMLVDEENNGQGGGFPEALYLWGNFDRTTCAPLPKTTEIPGLRIYNGSILHLGSCISAVTRHQDPMSGEWAWLVLNELFGPGEELVPYDQGFIQRTVCYADCDISTGVCALDIFDFLCFGNEFSAGSPYACDCDTSTGPGVCDIFDFLCFGNAFDAGCP